MKQPNDRIIVAVNMAQKNQITIAGCVFKTAMIYETNYREKSPVVAEVVEGNRLIQKGDVIISHHNHYTPPSPYYLYDNLFSIPFSKTIFAKLKPDGSLEPVCGNIIGRRVDIETLLPVAPEDRKQYTDRLLVTDGGWTKFRPGDLVFTRPHAPYDIVFVADKIEQRITKVPEDQIVGVEKKYAKP